MPYLPGLRRGCALIYLFSETMYSQVFAVLGAEIAESTRLVFMNASGMGFKCLTHSSDDAWCLEDLLGLQAIGSYRRRMDMHRARSMILSVYDTVQQGLAVCKSRDE